MEQEVHDDDREWSGRFAAFAPRRALLATAATLLVLFGGARLLIGHPGPADFARVESRSELEVCAERIRADRSREIVVLLGDSVCTSSALRRHGHADPESHTVAAEMRRAVSPSADLAVYDLSMDGLLPADMHAIQEAIDAKPRRGEGRLRYVVEIIPRVLARSNSDPDGFLSRSWMDRPEGAAAAFVAGLFDWRHRLPRPLRYPELPRRPSVLGKGMADLVRRISGPEYFEPDLRSPQIEMYPIPIEGASAAEVLYFHAPLNIDYIDPGRSHEPTIRRSQDRIETSIRNRAGGKAEVLHLDQGLFPASLYFDHCHLIEAGNAVLARALLEALGLPIRR